LLPRSYTARLKKTIRSALVLLADTASVSI
jgi:hypothetical protein